MPTYAQKKYLFAIYKLGCDSKNVCSADVAKMVGVSKASMVKMSQRLSDDGYIYKAPYGKITLTEAGIREANALFTNCVVIIDFLKKLGIDEEKADTDAVTIVSRVSEETLDGLVEYALHE